MSKTAIETDGRQLIKRAAAQGCIVRAAKGDHVLVQKGAMAVVIPNRKLGKGLACKIVKKLTTMGVLLTLLVILVHLL